ncbi:hypothetical protein EC845_0520 [Comamonas sp. BIGb0124]|uniref:hypothetical protein n=1 Tax=Comamonas sp. BIGb0124 TaxID=2485130 RepID=UPI000F9BEF6A|nr:hypothetical protein [Comamonas sp. BIGb0124]ROR24495.1 hypothetical protein EC845_0520 [Comamonas sp. BIGb0124]
MSFKMETEGRRNLLEVLYGLIHQRRSDVNQLLQADFYRSFNAWEEFYRQCCIDSDELLGVDVYSEAVAKMNFLSPEGFWGREGARYIASLAPWGSRYDDLEGMGELRLHQENRAKSFFLYRSDECSRFCGQLDDVNFPAGRFSNYLTEEMIASFSNMGLLFDEVLSRDVCPVVSRPFIDGWKLCFSPESSYGLEGWPMVGIDRLEFCKVINFRFYLCPMPFKKVITPESFRSGKLLNLPLGCLLNGFAVAYNRMTHWRDLRVCLLAYSTLYRALDCEIGGDFAMNFSRIVKGGNYGSSKVD